MASLPKFQDKVTSPSFARRLRLFALVGGVAVVIGCIEDEGDNPYEQFSFASTSTLTAVPGTPAAAQNANKFKRGDANLDGILDVSDGIKIGDFLASRTMLDC